MAKRIADRYLRKTGHLSELLAELKSAEVAAAAAAPEPIVEMFDPYAFGAVVVLERLGPAALLNRLDGIDDVGHLRQLAEAQHLSVDPNLSHALELRSAILRGAEERIAERRAAAS
jgi:hypothetical protein